MLKTLTFYTQNSVFAIPNPFERNYYSQFATLDSNISLILITIFDPSLPTENSVLLFSFISFLAIIN